MLFPDYIRNNPGVTATFFVDPCLPWSRVAAEQLGLNYCTFWLGRWFLELSVWACVGGLIRL